MVEKFKGHEDGFVSGTWTGTFVDGVFQGEGTEVRAT